MDIKQVIVAYFCAEFGIDHMPLGGGLGILAGDHIKSCSDLHIPTVGVGLHYKMGNVHQALSISGKQTEYFEPFEPTGLMSKHNTIINVPMGSGVVPINGWRLEVHSSIPGDHYHNNIEYLNDRDLLDELYPGGDHKIKLLKQEMILGYGGVKFLDTLGYDNVKIFHANEGHAALMTFALREKYGSTEEARKHMVFTTHTPVPAGIDIYSKEQAEGVLPEAMRKEAYKSSGGEEVHMMKLAMDNAFQSYAVSKLHRDVSQKIFCDFPNMRNLSYVDNGVHLPTWVSPEAEGLYDIVTDGRWRTDPRTLEETVAGISNEEVLGVRHTSRSRLGEFLKTNPRVTKNMQYDPNNLTIGFARRFAPYKQAKLILENWDVIKSIKNVQFVFAGKAHGSDQLGKDIIREVFSIIREQKDVPMFFIRDYDMIIARYMVQGVDLWLNTPEQLKEASGTSGMKAAANFVPQFSVLDGWYVHQEIPGYRFPKGWVEGKTGWSIGPEPSEASFLLLGDTPKAKAARERAFQRNSVEAATKLRDEILPTFEPDKDWMKKKRWAEVCRTTAAYNPAHFNSHRMVIQDFEKYGIDVRQWLNK